MSRGPAWLSGGVILVIYEVLQLGRWLSHYSISFIGVGTRVPTEQPEA